MAAGRLDRLNVNLPPRHGKSQLVSQFFPAWFLLVYPWRRVILCSYEADFAAQWGRKVRDLVIQWGPQFGVAVASDSKAADRWEIHGHGGGMQTAGVGGPILGKGADLLILDDICIAGGQLVTTRRGEIPIENVVVGDEVITHLGRWRRVTATHDRGEKEVIAVSGGGRQVLATPEHLLHTSRGWVEAQHAEDVYVVCVRVNEKVGLQPHRREPSERRNGQFDCPVQFVPHPVSQIEKRGTKRVYDLTVEEDSSFVVEGIVVHNCKNADEALSATYREKTWNWYTSTAYSRLEPGAAVVHVQQRWHTDDMTGRLHDADPGRWKSLVFPALAEEGDVLGRSPGEALWPERYSVADLEEKRRLTPTWFAAQYQQVPIDREGGFFRSLEQIPIVGAAPTADQFVRVVRAWDLAATEAQTGTDPDWTVGAKLGRHKDGTFWVLDVQRARLGPQGVRDLIRQTAAADGDRVAIFVEREGGASGKIAARSIVTDDLAGYAARAVRPEGSKAERAEPWGAQIEAGNVRLVRGEWVRPLLAEHQSFPSGAHDDIVDACSGAFRQLATPPPIFTAITL